MISTTIKSKRVLAIDPSARGFGYVVLECPKSLVDWGLKEARENKNAKCLRQIGELIKLYTPDLIAVEDIERVGSQRSERVKKLIRQIHDLARKHRMPVRTVSKAERRKTFESCSDTSKAGIAQALTKRFPELAMRLPRPRKPWEGSDPRMALFGAMAIAIVTTQS